MWRQAAAPSTLWPLRTASPGTPSSTGWWPQRRMRHCKGIFSEKISQQRAAFGVINFISDFMQQATARICHCFECASKKYAAERNQDQPGGKSHDYLLQTAALQQNTLNFFSASTCLLRCSSLYNTSHGGLPHSHLKDNRWVTAEIPLLSTAFQTTAPESFWS